MTRLMTLMNKMKSKSSPRNPFTLRNCKQNTICTSVVPCCRAHQCTALLLPTLFRRSLFSVIPICCIKYLQTSCLICSTFAYCCSKVASAALFYSRAINSRCYHHMRRRILQGIKALFFGLFVSYSSTPRRRWVSLQAKAFAAWNVCLLNTQLNDATSFHALCDFLLSFYIQL